MNITKEQVEELVEFITHHDRYSIVDKLKEILPEAFKSEVQECDLYTECVDTEGHEKIDTGSWKIFDSGDEIYVVHKDLKTAVQFPKVSDGTDWDFMQDYDYDFGSADDIAKIVEKIKEKP
jgi:hypothetical protein